MPHDALMPADMPWCRDLGPGLGSAYTASMLCLMRELAAPTLGVCAQGKGEDEESSAVPAMRAHGAVGQEHKQDHLR
jgi:hypothetical protein